MIGNGSRRRLILFFFSSFPKSGMRSIASGSIGESFNRSASHCDPVFSRLRDSRRDRLCKTRSFWARRKLEIMARDVFRDALVVLAELEQDGSRARYGR